MPCRSTSRTISTSPGSNTWSIATDGTTTRSGFAGMGKILAILDRHEVKATFFFSAGSPTATRKWCRGRGAGHEIGIHSYAHRLVYHQRPDEFAADLEPCWPRSAGRIPAQSSAIGPDVLHPR